MINTKAIAVDLDRLESMKLLIQAYEEIAAIRMRKIRSTVLASRDFNLGLDLVYQNLLLSYRKQIDEIMLQKAKKNHSSIMMERNGKTICIFLSANTGLYGDILRQTYLQFVQFISSHQSDIAIIGKYGKNIFTTEYPTTPFTFFDFPDTNIPDHMLSKFLTTILQYENIFIFYGKFDSMASQSATMLDVYGQEKDKLQNRTNNEKFLFEPSLETILVFFEKEIFASIISQTLKESELAKYAARMVALDGSVGNVNKSLSRVHLLSNIAKHRDQNKKQLEALSAIRLIKLR